MHKNPVTSQVYQLSVPIREKAAMWSFSSSFKWCNRDISDSSSQWIQKKASLCKQSWASLPDLLLRCLSKHTNTCGVHTCLLSKQEPQLKMRYQCRGARGKLPRQEITPMHSTVRNKYSHSDLRCIPIIATPLKGRWLSKSQASNTVAMSSTGAILYLY